MQTKVLKNCSKVDLQLGKPGKLKSFGSFVVTKVVDLPLCALVCVHMTFNSIQFNFINPKGNYML
jgi:hypothetical protein